VRRFTRSLATWLGGVILLSAVSCTPAADRIYKEARSEIERGHFRVGLDLLIRAAETEKNSELKFKHYLEAARIARFEVQDFQRAIRLNKEIILKSPDEKLRINAQESVAEIYFENLLDYAQALKELQKLEPIVKESEQRERVTLKICQALYLTGDPARALDEISLALRSAKTEVLSFLKVKAQAQVALKKYEEALATYEHIFQSNPQYFEKENLFMAVSVVYEEKEDYAAAIKYLNTYGEKINDKAYLELRHRRLQERLVNKPLFQGKRK